MQSIQIFIYLFLALNTGIIGLSLIIMSREASCEHYKNLRIAKKIDLQDSSACRYCLIGKNHLWMCLTKNCGMLVCDRNSQEHLKLHLDQYRNKKAFHSIFINMVTARIVCIHCQLEILDLDQIKGSDNLPDPYPLRVKILPGLLEFDRQKNKSLDFKIAVMGQLENSEGHRKINRALTGFFSDKYSHVINSALQFLMQFEFYRELVLKVKPESRDIEAMQKIFRLAEYAEFRAIHTEELTKLIFNEKPHLLGYSRKDPFEHVLYFLTKMHERIKYYSLDDPTSFADEWDLLGKSMNSSSVNLNCPLFDSISFTLNFNYECSKCKFQQTTPGHYNFLKISFPKKKRKVKEVEKQLAQHKYSSPVKNRRKSLMNLFRPEEECPFTIAELIIQFLKQPFHKDRNCPTCKQKMKKNKISFAHLPQYLIIQVNRMSNDGNSIDKTSLQFSLDDLQMGAFTSDKDQIITYQFQSALCLENECMYPVVAKSRFNKQAYIFKGELITMLRTEKHPANPYVLCYKRKKSELESTHLKDCFNNVNSSVETAATMSQTHKLINLPDFWLTQIQFSIARPLHQQLVCKHSKRKPNIWTKMKIQERVPIQVYEYLLEEFTGKAYDDQECRECNELQQKISIRKTREKQMIMSYQKCKSSCHCMISNVWLMRWMDFLYKKGEFTYFSQGCPMPGPIDNKVLLEGQQCKANLQKNVDYKVVNIFIWRLLKDLYGGGPEIRYKWNKSNITEEQQKLIKEVRINARQIKQIYIQEIPESPKKSVIIERTTSYVESVRESDEGQIQDDLEQIEQKSERIQNSQRSPKKRAKVHQQTIE